MRNRSRKYRGRFSGEAVKKYRRLLIIPVVVLLLLMIIVVVDKGLKKADTGGESSEEQSYSEEESQIDVTTYNLRQDEIPELTALVQAYVQAKTDCDPSALWKVFGKSEISEEELNQEKAKMELVRQAVDGYVNVSCYYVDGLEADSYVIYPYFEIQYKDIQTVMPSLTWSYAKKDADGEFYMTQDVNDAESQHIAKISQTEDVRLLVSQIEERVGEASSESQTTP